MAALAGKSWISSARFKKKLAENKIFKEIKRVYGRRHGRPLSASRQNAFEEIYPLVEIPLELLTEQGNLDPFSLFTPLTRSSLRSNHPLPHGEREEAATAAEGEGEKTILEIGFGNGERLAEAMRREPGANYIGAEPFLNGMTAFLKNISTFPSLEGGDQGEGVESTESTEKSNTPSLTLPLKGEGEMYIPPNIRALMDDALLIVRSLTDESVDEIYILNPDPWHKSRHHKRRIVRAETLPDYHRILKPGGKLIMTTDVVPLADWMQTETEIFGEFDWTAETPADWQNPPKNWIPTRYETKKAKGASKMTYLVYQKKGLPKAA